MPTAVNAMQIYYGAPTVWQALFMLRSLPLPGNGGGGGREAWRQRYIDERERNREISQCKASTGKNINKCSNKCRIRQVIIQKVMVGTGGYRDRKKDPNSI